MEISVPQQYCAVIGFRYDYHTAFMTAITSSWWNTELVGVYIKQQ